MLMKAPHVLTLLFSYYIIFSLIAACNACSLLFLCRCCNPNTVKLQHTYFSHIFYIQHTCSASVSVCLSLSFSLMIIVPHY